MRIIQPYFRVLFYLNMLALSACGSGDTNSVSDAHINSAITTTATNGSSGGTSIAPDSWEVNTFNPASRYIASCINPRTGTNPATGQPYADTQGGLLDENNWLRSMSNDLYLWYDEIEDMNPANFSSTADYFPVLKTFATTVSGKLKDEFHFSIPTAEWLQLSQSGVSSGYGVTWAFISTTPPRKVVVAYTEPASPATSSTVNLARGATILEIDGIDLVNANTQAEIDALNAALFPKTDDETHRFTLQDLGASNSREVTMISTTVTSEPVKNVTSIDTESGKVGYILFNDHIATAEQALINAVNQLRTEGINDLVLDLRYNGGGFLGIASELAYMIAGQGLTAGLPFETISFNDKHSQVNPFTNQTLTSTPFFDSTLGFSVSPGQNLPTLDLNRVYVITGPGTCSASESVINSLLGVNVEVVQIGSTTCGKPFGFYPLDNCGVTYFTINFVGENAKDFGAYTDGFSPVDKGTITETQLPGCPVADDFTHQLGDPAESRLAAALAYRDNGLCPDSSRSGKTKPSLLNSDGITPKPWWLENRIMRH